MLTDQQVAHLSNLSRLIGWTYFLCWSFSSYPQPIVNYRRKSVTGLSVDYFTVNILGHLCYTASCLAYLYSETVREQYRNRFPDAGDPTVRVNDLATTAHALFWSSFAYTQFYFWGYSRSPLQHLSRPTFFFMICSLLSILGACCLVLLRPEKWEWLDVLNLLTILKLTIVVIKYFPQVRLNYLLKSTTGWSIHKCALDFSGGILSLGQLLIDAYLAGDGSPDWEAVTGNSLKFWLGLFSSALNAVFVVQHVWYKRGPSENERPLEEGRRTSGKEETEIEMEEKKGLLDV